MSHDTALERCPTCGQHLPAVAAVATGPRPSEKGWPGRAAGLSKRESQVVALIAQGLSNKQISAEMYLGVNTIKTYVRTSYRKMGVDSRARAVRWAVTHGFAVGEPAIPPARWGLGNTYSEDRT